MRLDKHSTSDGFKAAFFGNVASEDVLRFMEDGDLNYRQVSEFLGFDKEELSKIAHLRKSSVRLDERIPKDLKDRLTEIANICNLVAGYFDGDAEKTALWFRVPNPMLGGVSPRDMLRLGRYQRLSGYIQRALTQNQEAGAQTAA